MVWECSQGVPGQCSQGVPEKQEHEQCKQEPELRQGVKEKNLQIFSKLL